MNDQTRDRQKVLVLGGYGLIGAAVCRHLLACGYAVTGLGRNTATAAQQMPGAQWIDTDIARLTTAQAWIPLLEKAAPDAIVNCSGALQDGSRDRLADVQSIAMQALFEATAAQNIRKFVQVSAPRAAQDASTAFMRTKGQADAALVASQLEWTILRPGLVLSAQAYGGTALLRALAATPFVLPAALGDRKIQTVHVDAISEAIADLLAGRVQNRRIYDLVEDEAHSLLDILRLMRAWLGLAPAPVLPAPEWTVRAAARIADLFGWLGWRSPLRTTAIEELSAGVIGDPLPWRQASGRTVGSLQDSLQKMPASIQERWFARLFFIKPIAIAVLSAFWLATGLITLANPAAAVNVLDSHGGGQIIGPAAALMIVIGGAIIDIGLGLAVLVRKWVTIAAAGMILVTLAYLAGGSILTPGLWLDPLGPLVKPIPAMVLALVVLALAQDR